MAAKIIEFDLLLSYFIFWKCFLSKIITKTILPLEYMVLAAIYIIIPGLPYSL